MTDDHWRIEWLVDPDTLTDPRQADMIRHLRTLGDLRCTHGNASGACSECRNGIGTTTGDVA